MHLPFSIVFTSFLPAFLTLGGTTLALSHANAAPINHLDVGDNLRNVSLALFMELEELARLVDIAYCVGVTGIRKPFECLSRCIDFPGFELVDVRPSPFSLLPSSPFFSFLPPNSLTKRTGRKLTANPDMEYRTSIVGFLWLRCPRSYSCAAWKNYSRLSRHI